MPRRPMHKESIVRSAVTLFRRRGYSATGLNDIVDASGAPKGSVYYYFPHGKPSIAEAAVIEAGQRLEVTLRKLAETAASTSDLLQSHARLLSGWMSKSGYRDGCPITTVLLELAPEDRAVTKAGREAYAGRIAILKERLIGDGFTQSRAEALAILCTSAIQGALIQSRIARSSEPILITARQLGDLIDSSR
ncbi:TetR/AcrR family transcriptional regulator [Bradyrhizobium tropiciagri]|uniref:TetR/AcrR family transcriptional regulator n=1 Tax=Bradyrhizobium tropiciagri TaxID=312253 RepID=UPI001BA99CCF|nr:TetR/AcrR family transcriptional regulator [Bradyrhizobium tropiciagri]MBR0894960.1 TetR/AcrR family transcriptional regulator [Bradyrhizobium tropiciagri]